MTTVKRRTRRSSSRLAGRHCPHLVVPQEVIDSIELPVGDARRCGGCAVVKDVWMCITCGFCGCGRMSEGKHAFKHWRQCQHVVAIEIHTFIFYCFTCDVAVASSATPPLSPKKRKPSINKRAPTGSAPIQPGFIGLLNLGNSCFFSSVLQVLTHIKVLKEYFLDPHRAIHFAEVDKTSDIATTSLSTRPQRCAPAFNDTHRISMVSEMFHVMESFWCAPTDRVLAPVSFFAALRFVFPRFQNFGQQDAQECLRLVLERMDFEFKERPEYEGLYENSQESSPISRIFQGSLSSMITCSKCDKVSDKTDPFLDVSIDIPHTSIFVHVDENSKDAILRNCSLHDCLKRFCRKETLTYTDTYLCGGCNNSNEAVKHLQFSKLPEVLCIHLKRFHWDETKCRKLSSYVDFPVDNELDMQEYCTKDVLGGTVYKLAGLVQHHGPKLASGHYTAFAQHPDAMGVWAHYDDANVTSCGIEYISHAATPYILFYTRV